jgi:hypothetical protein
MAEGVMSSNSTTVKAARNGGEFPSPLIYKHKPLVIIGVKEKIVLWAGSQDDFQNEVSIASGYYDDCELKAREHDLNLNDNTRIERDLRDRSADFGIAAANKIFQKRGNHSEAHIRRDELAAMLAAAYEVGTRGREASAAMETSNE